MMIKNTQKLLEQARAISPNEIVRVRRRTKQIADLLGIEAAGQIKIATAVSEIVRNALTYAGPADIMFVLNNNTQDCTFEVVISDNGPGITSLDSKVQDGRNYTGLSAAKRLVDHFDVKTNCHGTTITLGKLIKHRQGPFDEGELQNLIDALKSRSNVNPYDELYAHNQELLSALAFAEEQAAALSAAKANLELQAQTILALNDKLATVTDKTNVGFIVVDRDGITTYLNPAAIAMTGYSLEELKLQLLHDTIHAPYHNDTQRSMICDCPIYQSIRSNQPLSSSRYTFYRKDGMPFEVDLSTHPIKNGDDNHGSVIEFTDVTQMALIERKTKEDNEKLQKSEARFRQLAQCLPHIVWIADNKRSCRFLNDRWFSYAGLKRDDDRDRLWTDIVHPDDLLKVNQKWKEAIETGSQFEDEHRLRSADGSYHWFLTRGIPVLDEDQAVAIWFGTCTDIQYQKDLAKKEESHFKLIAEAIPQAVWTTTPDGYCDYMNSRWHELTGQPLEESFGDGWIKVLHPDDAQSLWANWQAVLKTGTRYETEYRLKMRDGEYRWFLGLALPVKDESGRIIKWLGTTNDIHARKARGEELEKLVQERTEQLAQAKAFTDLIIESMSDALITVDADGHMNYLNEAARHLYSDQLMPNYIDEVPRLHTILVPQTQSTFPLDELPIKRALGGESVNDVEMNFLQNDDIKVISASARPFKDSAGKIKGAVAALRDITLRKRAELALKIARDEAIAANEAKSRFLSTVSHEVRTPMAGIIGLVELIDSLSKSEEIKLLSQTALDSCKRLLQILNDLLDASKLQAGKVTLENRLFAVRPVIGDVVQLVRIEAAKKSLLLVSNVESDVPEMIYGDELRIRQILLNLLFNALKFTPQGQITINVQVIDRRKNETIIRFSVEDTGLGITKQQRERLFEPFTQADDSTTRVFGGTGLGLSICKTLTELMNGKIDVISEAGCGSNFFVDIPFEEAECQTG